MGERELEALAYRGTSPTRKHQPPRTPLEPFVQAYGRVLGGGGVLMSEVFLYDAMPTAHTKTAAIRAKALVRLTNLQS